jgi:phage-related protein
MNNWTVELYQKPDDSIPVLEFLQSLPLRDRAKMERTIQLLSQLGPMIRMPHARPIENEAGLFELRSIVGNNIQRICYFHFTGSTFVLLNGFTKKTQKTPPAEIERAKKYKSDYLNQQEAKSHA